jgi:DNA-binding CsgD family transcriptional regulator
MTFESGKTMLVRPAICDKVIATRMYISNNLSVTTNNSKFAIEERRRQVSFMLARSMTEQEIAQALSTSQSTISTDVKALREMSTRFVYDLAKSDLAFYYKQKLDSLDQVKREAWKLYDSSDTSNKEKLLALKVIVASDETTFKLLSEGPAILSIKALEERLATVEAV